MLSLVGLADGAGMFVLPEAGQPTNGTVVEAEAHRANAKK